jgi:predicted  nucleic acid-binding Zn-ribbon protein
VGNIVDSLFADYLPRKQQAPVRVADPRQQTMLTNQMLTPVMNKPTKPSQKVPVFPSVGGIGGGTVPTQPPAAPVSDQTLTPVMPKPTPPPAAPVSSNSDIRYSFVPSDGNYDFGNNWSQPEQSPVMSKPTTPSLKAPQELINPVTTTEEKQQYDQLFGANVSGGVVPTEEETTEPVAYDPSNINLAALENINTGGFDITDLGLFQEGGIADDVFKGLDITQRDEVNPDAWVDVFNSYSDFLGSVESGDTADKVNRRDDIYNNYYNENTTTNQYLGDPSAFRAAVGLSDAFSVYDKAGSTITNESLQEAYQALTSGANPVEALSAYYGFEIQPTSNEGANYTNAAKYGTDAQRMAEFQSLVEPILQKSIPYIQATQGLNYTDALEYAYTHDPMLAAVYQSYGVDLFRQTKDGSTYIYDPIAGQEIRTLEVKDARFKDVFPSLVKAGIIALATGGIGAGLGGALGMTAGQTAALTGALGSLAQGGDPKDAILAAVTGGISGGLTDAVGKALGVSKEVATGITQAGLAAAQGAGSKEALLSGFLAGVGEYIRGETPAANQDFEQFGGDVDAVNPQGFVNTATTRAETKAATDAIKTAATQNPAATMGETLVIAQRNNPNIAADVLASAAQQVASGAVTPKGGMLTKDTPAGDVEEVIVTPTDDVRYTMPTKDGAIIQTATKLTATPFGQQFLTGVQTVDPAGHNEILKQIEAGADSITWRGRTILVSDLMGATKTTTQAPEIVSKEPKQPEGASLPDKPTAEDVEPQPDLPLEEDMEIPEFDIENLPPDFNAEIPEVVTPPVTPETPVVPRPTEGGGGGSAGGVVVPPPVTPPATPPPAAPEAPTDEVVDVFDDGGLTGDAFDDSTTGGAEGGAAEDVAVDVTDTEEYRDLQEELNTTRANQETLETTVAGLQDEVAAANAAAKQAQEAAAAAEAAGAANADKLRGEAVAAQANAERVQNELDTANEALGSANSTIESLQTELGTTQQERDVAKKEVTELTKTLDTTKADVETKTKEINTLNTTVSTLNKDVDKLNTELKNANNTVKDIQEELNKAKETNATNVKDLEQKLADAKSKATTTKENLDSKTKELETANGTIKTLTSEVDTANSTIKDLNKQLETKQSEIESTKAELGTAKESNVELTKELEKTNTEVATLEGKLSTVKETNTDLTKRLEDSNTKVGELNENLSSAKEDLASLKDEYAEAVVSNKKNVDSLEKKVKSKESEIKGLEKNIKDADSTVKSLEGEISKNKQEITGLEGSLSEALKAVSGLESSLAESEAATKAAIAKGIADAEGAGKEGLGKGLGAGAGLGSAIGLLGGFGMGQAQGGGGVPYTRPEAKDFMAKLNFNLPEAERVQQQQLQDYVGMLLGNMR